MNRRWIAGTLVVVVAALALAFAVRACAGPRPAPPSPADAPKPPAGVVELAPLRRIPSYRALIEAKAVRSLRTDPDGTLHIEADLRAAFEPRLAAAGLAGASDLLPASAKGAIAKDAQRLHETWTFDQPAPIFDLLDRAPAGTLGSPALDAIPGAPTAIVCVHLMTSRLADPALGGPALSSWRDRVAFAEKLLGRAVRAELAEDLAGPAIFALYDTAGVNQAQAVLSLELKRADRIASLLDMLFALGALTERGTVRRYRGVATGSFASASGGPGLALAIDGSVLVLATSRERLESALDARRAGIHHGGVSVTPSDPAASWSAVSASPFVAHGWARLLRVPDNPVAASFEARAELRPDGASGWRLTGEAPTPAFTADPVFPFLRSAFLRRQREGD